MFKSKINVIIPLAGSGRRFLDYGIKIPKPLIKINSFPLVEIAILSLQIKSKNFFFVKKEYNDHNYNKQLKNILLKYTNKSRIITTKNVLKGPVYSVLLVKKINKSLPLIILNCDQYLNWRPDKFFKFIKKKKPDGCVLTYKSKNKKNSFAKIDKEGKVSEIREKKVISNLALIGVHYWSKTSLFYKSAKELIKNKNIKEAFISETYNHLIKNNKRILTYNLNKKDFSLLGTPRDLKKFKVYIKKNEKKFFFNFI